MTEVLTKRTMNCYQCGKVFYVPLPVEREREYPDNCPPCFLKSSGKVSCWTDKFHYVEKEGE